MENPPRIIAIVGPDGTGKTTQAKRLVSTLCQSGFGSKYVWARFLHFASLPLLALAKAFGYSEMVELPNGQRIGYHYFYRSKVFAYLFSVVLLMDTFLMMTAKIYSQILSTRNTIVCDRFVYDTLVDLMISTGNQDLPESLLAELFVGLAPKDRATVMLLADENVLIERRDDVRNDRNLSKKVDCYRRIAEVFSIDVVDASLPIKEISRRILDIAWPSHSTNNMTESMNTEMIR